MLVKLFDHGFIVVRFPSFFEFSDLIEESNNLFEFICADLIADIVAIDTSCSHVGRLLILDMISLVLTELRKFGQVAILNWIFKRSLSILLRDLIEVALLDLILNTFRLMRWDGSRLIIQSSCLLIS